MRSARRRRQAGVLVDRYEAKSPASVGCFAELPTQVPVMDDISSHGWNPPPTMKRGRDSWFHVGQRSAILRGVPMDGIHHQR